MDSARERGSLIRSQSIRAEPRNRNGEAPDNAVYELRPYPSSALATDRLLHKKLAEKETKDWPVVQASENAIHCAIVVVIAHGEPARKVSLLEHGSGRLLHVLKYAGAIVSQ